MFVLLTILFFKTKRFSCLFVLGAASRPCCEGWQKWVFLLCCPRPLSTHSHQGAISITSLDDPDTFSGRKKVRARHEGLGSPAVCWRGKPTYCMLSHSSSSADEQKHNQSITIQRPRSVQTHSAISFCHFRESYLADPIVYLVQNRSSSVKVVHFFFFCNFNIIFYASN